MEIFQNIATVVGCISACITLLFAIIKPLRKWVTNRILRIVNHDEYRTQLASHTENINELKEFMMHHCEESNVIFQEIRDSMQKNNEATMNGLRYQLYEKTEEIFNRGYIKEKERELLTDMHDAYKGLHGNSYITDRIDRAFKMNTRD